MRVPPLGGWAGYQLASEAGLAVPGRPVRLGGGSVLSRRNWVHLIAAPTITTGFAVQVTGSGLDIGGLATQFWDSGVQVTATQESEFRSLVTKDFRGTGVQFINQDGDIIDTHIGAIYATANGAGVCGLDLYAEDPDNSLELKFTHVECLLIQGSVGPSVVNPPHGASSRPSGIFPPP